MNSLTVTLMTVALLLTVLFLAVTVARAVVRRELGALNDAMTALESAESVREAATLDALDKFDRLYKRMVARDSRQIAPQPTNAAPVESEPVLAFRDRVRAQRAAP